MKRFMMLAALACVMAGVFSNQGLAQTTAPANSQLTEAERKDAIQYLEETRKNFLAAVKGLSEAQWKFKAAPDRWSVAEVAEHIAISEETLMALVTDRIMKTPATPEKKESVKGKETLLRQQVVDRSQKIQAPEMLKPSNRWATQAELVKAFDASRDKTIGVVKNSQADMRAHFGPHPIFKELDAYQWIILIAGHSSRHTDQIKEVKADPNFPKK